MQKNTAGKWVVFAFDRTTNIPKTGDAANITANIRIDEGAANAVDDTHPAELESGYYVFDITAAEANGDNIVISPSSTTANIQVIGVPGAVWTTPPAFNALTVAAIQAEMEENGASVLDSISDKLPTHYIMGSAVQTDKDDDIDAILEDTGTTLDGKIDTIDTILDTLKAHLIISQKAINDATPTTTKFITTLTEVTNDYWNSAAILFTTGANIGVIRSIKDYVGGTKEVTLNTALPVAPSNGDAFSVIMARAFKLAGLEASEIEAAALAAVTSYDPPTRAEATTDKEAIITQVDANETKIDVVDGIVDEIKTETLTHPTAAEINTNLSSSHGSGQWTSTDPGSGDTLVNHDTGGADNLRYLTAGGVGIDEAIIKAFLKTDYEAGSRGEVNVKGRAITDVNGKWEIGMYLDAGNTYTIQFYKPGTYGPDTKEVTI